MKKIELLAPAKDIFKAKIAILYGADAVYLGGLNYSLRSRASNFTNDNIKEICEFAHQRNSRIFVTVNIVFHDEDYAGIEEYLKELESYGVDAIIISSVGLMQIAKKVAPKLECHMSTQLSTVNTYGIRALQSFGADRVVLGRECSIEQIEKVTKNSPLEVETFIHGGMCSNYSGRCVLSNLMTLRDANRGGCAQSCRWNYDVYQDGQLISDPNCPLSMSSKDLRATAFVEQMIKCGVSSLKIEGRMKSEYYIAQVVKTYRNLIDEVYEKGSLTKDRIDYYDDELNKAENRPSDSGFLSGVCDNTKHLYGKDSGNVTNEYVGLVKNYNKEKGLALIEVKNKINLNETLEAFGPNVDNVQFENTLMINQKDELLDMCNLPQELIWIKSPIELHENDMVRVIR